MGSLTKISISAPSYHLKMRQTFLVVCLALLTTTFIAAQEIPEGFDCDSCHRCEGCEETCNLCSGCTILKVFSDTVDLASLKAFGVDPTECDTYCKDGADGCKKFCNENCKSCELCPKNEE